MLIMMRAADEDDDDDDVVVDDADDDDDVDGNVDAKWRTRAAAPKQELPLIIASCPGCLP